MSQTNVNQGAWLNLETVLRENYENPDIEAAKIFYSVTAAHRISDCSPCWLLLIAPSGSMKTDLIESLRGLPNVHLRDEVTAKTFISGKLDEGRARKQPASFLHRMGRQGILGLPDFSTFVCQDPRVLQTVLSQLRRIFDGNYAREFGTEENLAEREWSGRLTLIAGATPDIDQHFRIFQVMGERFIRVRSPRAGGIKSGIRALGHRKALAPILRQAASDLLLPIFQQPEIAPPEISSEMSKRISALTELVCLARTYVPRDRDSRDIVCEPSSEGNTRLPQEAAQVGRGWAALNCRSAVGDEEFALLRRACLDSMPPVRRQLLSAVEEGVSPYSLHLPDGTVSRAIEDLDAVSLIEKHRQTFQFTDSAKCLISQAGGDSHFFVCERRKKEDAA